MYDQLRALRIHEHIRRLHADRRLHAFRILYIREILIREAERPGHTKIHHVLLIIKGIRRKFHVHTARTQSGKHGCTQQDDKENGNETAEILSDLAEKIFPLYSHQPFSLPFNVINGHRMRIILHLIDAAVFDVNHTVRHIGQRRIVRDNDHRHAL